MLPGGRACPLGEHYIEYADTLMELRLLPEAAERGPPRRGGVRAPPGSR